jgi:hypothetical protein
VADELAPKNLNEENEENEAMGSIHNEEEVRGKPDEEEEFEDIDETGSDEEDLES